MGSGAKSEGLEAGTRVLRYTILGKLAQGGMAEVYLAQQLGPAGYQKLVVVKRVRPQLASDPDFVAMFVNEARLAAMLNHPNVVQIFDLGQEGTDWYLAMEYLDGRDMLQLGRACRAQKKAVPFDVTARILADACAALDHAHQLSDAQGNSLNLVHRDMSPENILLTFNGMVKVVDFGIAKAADNIHQTQAGQIKGKLGYVAPEAILGKKLDGRADIFAVGATLYLFLCGRPAFSGKTPMEVFEKSLAPPPPPTKFNPRIPKALESICMTCLAQDREQRYQTAGEVRTALESYLIGTKRTIGAAQLSQFMGYLFPPETDKIRARIEGMIAKGNEVAAADHEQPTQAAASYDDSATVSVMAPAPEPSIPSVENETRSLKKPADAGAAKRGAFGMRSLELADQVGSKGNGSEQFAESGSHERPSAAPVQSEEFSVDLDLDEDIEVTAVSAHHDPDPMATSPGGGVATAEPPSEPNYVNDEETVINTHVTEPPKPPPPPVDSAESGPAPEALDLDLEVDLGIDITDSGMPPTAVGAMTDAPLDLVSAMEVRPGDSLDMGPPVEKTATGNVSAGPSADLDVLDQLVDAGDAIPPPPTLDSAALSAPQGAQPAPLADIPPPAPDLSEGMPPMAAENLDIPPPMAAAAPPMGLDTVPDAAPVDGPRAPLPAAMVAKRGFGIRLFFFTLGLATGFGLVGGLLFAGGFIPGLMKRFGL
jgi:serine/threonine-protein kinase